MSSESKSHPNALSMIRKNRGISQLQLAKKSGVNVRMIQYYEQGIRDIRKAQARTVLALAKALNCTVEDITKIN